MLIIATQIDSSKFCNYCKNKGHIISECRKLQYKNQQNQNPRVNHLNSTTPSEMNALPENCQIQEAFNFA